MDAQSNNTNNSHQSPAADSAMPRGPVLIILAISVITVIAVLIGARIVYDRTAHQPIRLSTVDAPDAGSAGCTSLLENLPGRIGDFEHVDLLAPAPQGAAAWTKNSQTRITLRCGVDVPPQYTQYSQPLSDPETGTQWLRIADPTTQQSTWYVLNREVVVAVTTPDTEDPRSELSPAIDVLALTKREPNANPLAQLAASETSKCSDLMVNLPTFDGYDPAEVTNTFAVWRAADPASGLSPISLLCGINRPSGYTAGKQIIQVNEVPWFEQNGIYYALGLEATVAVSVPPGTDMAALSRAVSQYVP